MFHKYTSIETLKRIQKVQDRIPAESKWCVKEKVHGANFQLTTVDGQTVQGGKRSSLLTVEELETFYKAGKIMERYKDKICALFLHIRSQQVIVYGELYGGSYPNHKSPTKPVQKEVLYCPHVDFIAFDIKVDGEYLSEEQSELFFRKFDIPFISIDFIGSFDECLQFSKSTNENATEIPTKKFNLVQVENNIREGNVIKPYTNVLYFHNGSRAIFKNKNTKFAEQNIVPKTSSKHQKEKMSFDTTEVYQYCVENRWNALVSKEGSCDDEKRPKYISMFIDDAMKDYCKDKELVLTKVQFKYIKNMLFPKVWKFEYCK